MRYFLFLTTWIIFQSGIGVAANDPIEPKVKEEISKLGDYLGQSNTISFQAEVTDVDVSSTLQRLHYQSSIRGAVKRPNKLFIERTGEENNSLWFNGSQIVILDRKTNKFIRVPFTGNLDALQEKLEALKVELPFGGLLRADILKKVEAHVFRGDHYGRALVEGTDCSHLALRQDSIDWQAWIATDGSPKKLVITSKMLTGMPEHEVLFRDVKRNEAIEDSVFNATVSKDATEVPVAGGDL